MDIAVLEYDLALVGGRQQTMVSGFADYFAEKGHSVSIYGNFLDGHIDREEDILKHHLADNLTPNDFHLHMGVERGRLSDEVVKEVNRCDLLLVPYPGYSTLQKQVKCPMAVWYIARSKNFYGGYRGRIWTNSHTTKEVIGRDDAVVVYPPHNYLEFRVCSREWDRRDIDVLMATAVTKRRERMESLNEAIVRATELHMSGMKVVGLFLTKTWEERDFVKRLPFETHINVPRRAVADYMGRSKVFLHPSPLESCSLSVYEALNAGCYPIIRRAGAVEEQLGDVGHIYEDFEEATNHIKKVLSEGYHYDWRESQDRGIQFDRIMNKTLKSELSLLRGVYYE